MIQCRKYAALYHPQLPRKLSALRTTPTQAAQVLLHGGVFGDGCFESIRLIADERLPVDELRCTHQEVANVGLVLHHGVWVAEPSDVGDTTRAVETEPGRLPVPLVGIERSEVSYEHPHALVGVATPCLSAVLVVVPDVRHMVHGSDDPLVQPFRRFQRRPVPCFVDADMHGNWKALPGLVLAVLLTVPDDYLVVVDVAAEDFLRIDDCLVVDGIAVEAQVVAQLDELLAIFGDELPFVAVLLEIGRCLIRGHDRPASRLHLPSQVKPTFICVPPLDGHAKVGAEYTVFAADEPEHDVRAPDDVVEGHLAAVLTGVTVGTDTEAADMGVAAPALAPIDVVELCVPK